MYEFKTRQLRASLSIVAFTLRGIFAQCESECGPISRRLEACSLPSLSTLDWRAVEDRGLIGREFSKPEPRPYTYIIEDPHQAKCLCVEARAYFRGCYQCLQAEEWSEEIPKDKRRAVDIYTDDCVNLGYYANDTLAYPSTTRSATPSATVAIESVEFSGDSDDDDGADDNCENLCGIVNGQIVECGLLALDIPKDDRPPIQGIESPERDYLGTALLNRTAAECVCTMPFLRRIYGCQWCLRKRERRDLMLAGYDYQFDCNQLGYYADSEYIMPEEEDVGAGPPSAPTSSNDDEPGGAVKDVMSTTVLVCALFLSHFLQAM